MRWFGTAVGGAIGLAFGPVGALFGAAIGQAVDRGMVKGLAQPALSAERRQEAQNRFFEATFQVMGHLAKADGRVSENEIAHAESVMERMGLSGPLRRSAIHLFNMGKATDFALAPVLQGVRDVCDGQGALLHLFLEVQLATAYVDGDPHPAQRRILESIRSRLRISAMVYRHLEMLVALQQRVNSAAQGARQRASAAPSREIPLNRAYATLGVESRASDAEVKRAYRLLISQHHPDKLMSRGLPEEALRLASQKTQEIRRAYETISRARGF